ncbi:MAG: right-handed parallel beta-helix repeat-containing protein [Planctomycetota bacterium]
MSFDQKNLHLSSIKYKSSSILVMATMLTVAFGNVYALDEFPPNTTHLQVDLGGEDLTRISAALEQAHAIQGPVAIHIAAGTYREGNLRILRREHPLWLLGDSSGQTVISGSDIWTDWESRGDELVAPWPYDWGNFVFDHPHWLPSDRKNLRSAGARSEMVFVNGQRLRQVAYAKDMIAGAFRIDLDRKEIIVRLPDGVDANEALIEVGMRPNLMTMLQPKDVIMRHLTFQHCTSHIKRAGGGQFDQWGISIFGEHLSSNLTNAEAKPDRLFAENVTIEYCNFLNNNKAGLSFANAKNLTIRHCRFDSNGQTGIGANRCRNVLIEDSTFNDNAWRLGDLGNAYASLPAGSKMLFMYELTFRRCEFKRNFSAGLWFDTSVNYVVVDECVIEDNWGEGFYYEHCQGPALIKNSVIARNGFTDGERQMSNAAGGVLFSESEHLTIDNCDIYDNSYIQIGVRARNRPGVCYWTGRTNDGSCRHLTLINSRIRGSSVEGDNVMHSSPAHRLSTLVGRQVHSDEKLYMRDFLRTYTASDNSYFNPKSKSVFAIGPNFGHKRVALVEWQALTGQDQGSQWLEH